MKPTVSLSQSGPNPDAIKKMMMDLQGMQVYVGVPEDTNDRQDGLLTRATKVKNHKRQMKLVQASEAEVTNAGLVYIHTHGSPLKGIPARPIIEPAIEAPDNKAVISDELAQAASSSMDVLTGTSAASAKTATVRHLKRAGMEAQNRVRGWFGDPRNGWAPNAPATIAAKGSDKPLVDTAEMKKAITFVVVGG